MRNNNKHLGLLSLCSLFLIAGCSGMPMQSSPQAETTNTATSGPVTTQPPEAVAASGSAIEDPLFTYPDPEHPGGTAHHESSLNNEAPRFHIPATSPMEEHILQGITASFSLPTLADRDIHAAPAGPAQQPEDAASRHDDDLWNRIRAGFSLTDYDHRRIAMEVSWFAEHQGYIDRFIERGKYYLYHIANEVEKRGMPMELALLPVVESAFQPFAYSHGRAAGIWQFIPSTGRLYGLKRSWWYDGRRDIVASTRAALDYLEQLNEHFDGDWLLALAAYNSGQGTVQHAIRRNQRLGRSTDFWSLRLPAETRGYVPRLLAVGRVVADPGAYDVTLNPIPDKPYFAKVDTGSQIDLALVAELTGLPLNEIYRLNPGYNRWATAPHGPHRLLLPVNKAEQFKQQLAELEPGERMRWVRHRVKYGETLGHIARRYHTPVSLIKEVNNINGHLIRAGEHLTVPVATQRLSRYTLSAGQRLQTIKNTPRDSNKIEHRVTRGDTLWDIARLYNVNVRKLAAWNGIAPSDFIHPGQHLVVWTDKANLAGSLKKTMLAGPAQEVATRRITYRVRRGDSLSRISQRFNVSVSQLRRWNAIEDRKYLQPGQKLTVYVDVTRIGDNI